MKRNKKTHLEPSHTTRNDYPVVAIGDSLVYGYPFGKAYSWVEIAAQKTKTPILNSGISGDTFWDIEQRIVADAIDWHPKYVFLLGGVNDCLSGTTFEVIEERFDKIIDLIVASEISPILCPPPPSSYPELEEKLRQLRKFFALKSKKRSFYYLDFYKIFFKTIDRTLDPFLMEDEIHPSVLGYQAMGKAAARFLNKIRFRD